MQMKTVWGLKAAKRLLKNAIEQSNFDAITARYRQLVSYSNSVTSNDFDGCVIQTVNLMASLSKAEILRALLLVSVTDVPLTSVSARTAIKLAQPLVRLQPDESALGCLTNLQHRLEETSDLPTMTKNRCLLELYALEMQLFWRMQRFENMDVVYGKALSIENAVLGSQHISSAHGYYGRCRLRSGKPTEAAEYLVKAVKGYQVSSIPDEHISACALSLALIAYTSAVSNADEMLDGYSVRRDVADIRRFAAAFLSGDVAALERTLHEIEDTFEDREVRRLLRYYEKVLKRKLCFK
ncbi:hypothetical protein AAVH_25568 [Aphelenchoides avenae]|nr:hypothetical protein AAVH_25568 [Aphelenchus avenae]